MERRLFLSDVDRDYLDDDHSHDHHHHHGDDDDDAGDVVTK